MRKRKQEKLVKRFRVGGGGGGEGQTTNRWVVYNIGVMEKY
jgi:hypothetical protein